MKNKSTKHSFKYYYPLYLFFKPKVKLILITFISIVVFSVLVGGLPLLTQKMAKAVSDKDLKELKRFCLLGASFFLVRGAFHFLKDFFSAKLSLEVLHSIRVRLFNHILSLDLEFFSKSKKVDLNYKITSELGAISGSVIAILQDVIPSFIMVLVLAFYLFYTNVYLTSFLLLLFEEIAVANAGVTIGEISQTSTLVNRAKLSNSIKS